MRDYVVAAWRRWVGVLADVVKIARDHSATKAMHARNVARAQRITDPARKVEVTARLEESASSLQRVEVAIVALFRRVVEVDAVLRAAVKYYDPSVLDEVPGPAIPKAVQGYGVGIPQLAVIAAAIAAIATIAAALAGVSYYVGTTRRNAEAETKLVDAVLAGQIKPGDASALLGALRPRTDAFPSWLWLVAIGGGALLFAPQLKRAFSRSRGAA